VLRRGRIVFGSALAALAGVALLFAGIGWVIWSESVDAEEAYAGGLAQTLGERTERIILDARDLLAGFDALPVERCSPEHLHALRDAAISRPYIRAIGHWRGAERLCGVGFLGEAGLKPARADRIYDTGVIAWWPGAQTEVGGVQLFLMRYGDHDLAIDPRLLLDLGPMPRRKAGLWVENLRMAAIPWEATLPEPGAVPPGITVDRANGVVVSHFARRSLLPIDVVAIEPIDSFWNRHAPSLALGTGVGLLLVAAWLMLVLHVSRRQLGLDAELREALARDRIRVHYQPVVDMGTGRCVGAEALARWERESGEAVGPDVFIPVAEESGLVQDVTLAVLRTTVREMRALLTEFPGTSINLNLAPDDLRSDRIGVELARTLDAAQLPPGALKLEITERALVNSDVSRALIREFRTRGHQVAVDDFGTGYSSLSYLQSFELDVLKIDKSFVDAIGTEAATSQVIVHVIEMARSLGLDTVAEGVESRAQVDWLLAHGVTHGQGYIFSTPLPAGEFIDYFRANRRIHP
jgi:sensor c-di-GMP phosphodiesterase-like protein